MGATVIFSIAGLVVAVTILVLLAVSERRRSREHQTRHAETLDNLRGIREVLAGQTATAAKLEQAVRDELRLSREEAARQAKESREEASASVQRLGGMVSETVAASARTTERLLGGFQSQLQTLTESNERRLNEIRAAIDARLKESAEAEGRSRSETGQVLSKFQENLVKQLGDMALQQRNQLGLFSQQMSDVTTANDQRMDALRQSVDQRLKAIQDDNSSKLEQMRNTVDEKLQSTLDRRLNESFKLVSERLESVQRGLGEMQVLASNVGDLKKVLANVSTRGGWGEVKLASLLEQILAPEQYGSNIQTKAGSNGRVEYAIKLPGKDEDRETTVWLPIDSKFPLDVYQRAAAAIETGDAATIDAACTELETCIVTSAKTIAEKYLDPPGTTDFAIMFLPVEGLYAEVLRRPGLAELLQRKFHVIVAGPTTLAALLNSLQMGFRTLAITKRSSEVWHLLGAIKTEFGRFGDVLSRVHKKLQEASNTVEGAEQRTRVIQRRLRSVQELSPSDASAVLPGGEAEPEAEPAEPDVATGQSSIGVD